MSRDEARKLLGGYATGSLTEAEQKALFEAALQDQELFDELAGEQALKDVLDEPGARQRLVTALEPEKPRAWLWGWAGAAATLAVVIGVVVSQRTPPPAEPPQQVAQVLKAPEPVVAPSVPAPQPVQRKVSPPLPAQPALVDAVAELRKEADQAKPQAGAGAVREVASARAASAFAFSYRVEADGFLEIIPTEPGYLSVTAWDQDLLSRPFVGAVTAGMAVRIQIPPDTSSLVVAYFRLPGGPGSPVRRDEMSGTVTDQDPPNGTISIQLFLKPATQ